MIFSDDSKFSEQPIVYVNATYNNTMLTLTDFKGIVKEFTVIGYASY
jgi:ribosomal protein S11